MLYLGPISHQESKAYFKKTNIEFNENSGCVCCKDGNEILGFSLYDLDKEKMTVKYIEPLNDVALADGILRSTLHIAAEHSILNAFYEDTVPCDFLEKIKFIKNEAEKRLDIDKLFQSCCNCG